MSKPRDLSGYGSREWTTRDGTVMKWSEMTTSHLRNTAAFIRRNVSVEVNAAWNCYSMVSSDAAEYAMECSLNSLEERAAEANAFARDMEDYAAFRERKEAA